LENEQAGKERQDIRTAPIVSGPHTIVAADVIVQDPELQPPRIDLEILVSAWLRCSALAFLVSLGCLGGPSAGAHGAMARNYAARGTAVPAMLQSTAGNGAPGFANR
jgi:hypothetical protein